MLLSRTLALRLLCRFLSEGAKVCVTFVDDWICGNDDGAGVGSATDFGRDSNRLGDEVARFELGISGDKVVSVVICPLLSLKWW